MIRECGNIESGPEPEGGTPVTLTGPVYRVRIVPLADTKHEVISVCLRRPKPDDRTLVVFYLDSLFGGDWTCVGLDSPILGPVELSLSGGHEKFSFITNKFDEE